MAQPVRHIVRKSSITAQSFVPDAVSGDTKISAGQVLVQLKHFGLNSQSVITPLAGDNDILWKFYPHEGDEEYGRIIVWGTATAVKSEVPAVKVGSLLYGCWPISTYSVVSLRLSEEDPLVLFETSPHREKLSVLYNRYDILPHPSGTRIGESSVAGDAEAFGTTVYPVFMAGYLLDLDVLTSDVASGKTVVFTDAASTAAAIAATRLKSREDIKKLIGLAVSKEDAKYATATGIYDEVYDYASVETTPWLDPQPEHYILADFSDHRHILETVQTLGAKSDSILLTVLGGSTGGSPPEAELPLPCTTLDAQKLYERREGEMGRLAFWKQFNLAFEAFVPVRYPGIRFQRDKGQQKILASYRRVVDGKQGCEVCQILSF